MSSNSGAPDSYCQLLPTQKNLAELLEKLLTIFGVESIVEGRVLPNQPLQRELGTVRRYILRPMIGNDFHVHTSFGTNPSWKALLQLDQGSHKIGLPLCHVDHYPLPEGTSATESTERVAKLLRSLWPDAEVAGPSKRRQLGPPFVDPERPDYQLFRWLASKALNPEGEGVFVTDLHHDRSIDLLYQPLRQRPVRLFPIVKHPCCWEYTGLLVGIQD
jgi:hypothetical protein